MNLKYLLLQAILLASVFASLFIEKNLFFKILLIFLLFFYALLILPEFKYNRERYIFSSSGFIVLAILFLFVRSTKGTTYVLILSCLLVLFMYLSRVLFSTTFGEVIDSSTNFTKVKILDELYSFNQKIDIRTTKKYAVGSLVLVGLDTSIFRKPKKIIKILEKSSIPQKKATTPIKKKKK